MINEFEQSTLDIDWFFTNGEEICFIASGGGKLPSSIYNGEENIKIVAAYFHSLPPIGGIAVNPNLDKIVGKDAVTDRYLYDFNEMATRGIYAYDKTVLNNYSDANYHLVAQPVVPLKINQLPFEIANHLVEVKEFNPFKLTLNIESI
ncbi:MAG: hypothetical protein V4619_18415 [Bacteroidota bacterium]